MQCAATAMYRYMFEQTHFASQPSSTVTMKSRILADMAATDMESKVENTGESMIRLRKAAGITVNRNYVENRSSHQPKLASNCAKPAPRTKWAHRHKDHTRPGTKMPEIGDSPSYKKKKYTSIYIFLFNERIVYPGVHPAPVKPAVAKPLTPPRRFGLTVTRTIPTNVENGRKSAIIRPYS